MASTVHDVAKRAGVSVGTVSRFLNGHKLRMHNALKVERAIRELDFTENLLAKGLKGNRSLTIAVLIPNLTGLFSFEIIKAMENVVEEQGYSLVIGDYEYSPQRLCKKLENLGRRSVDGLILFPLSYGELCRGILEQYRHRGIPVILMDDRIPEFQTDIVAGDQITASFRAVEHLVHNGHRLIAVVTGRKETNVTQERIIGSQEAFKTYGIPQGNLKIVWCDYTLSGRRRRDTAPQRFQEMPVQNRSGVSSGRSHRRDLMACCNRVRRWSIRATGELPPPSPSGVCCRSVTDPIVVRRHTASRPAERRPIARGARQWTDARYQLPSGIGSGCTKVGSPVWLSTTDA